MFLYIIQLLILIYTTNGISNLVTYLKHQIKAYAAAIFTEISCTKPFVLSLLKAGAASANIMAPQVKNTKQFRNEDQ